MPATREVRHLVLTDRAVPYLLARVRWPDVAQAITASNPDWLDDPGLFDLPYDRSAVHVTSAQAASVAAAWGVHLEDQAAEGAPSLVRRMPANWSELSPAELRAFGIESVTKRRVPTRHIRRLRAYRAKVAALSGSPYVHGHSVAVAAPSFHAPPPETRFTAGSADLPAGRDTLVITGSGDPGSIAVERRRHVRVRIDGHAHIRCGPATISAALVDLSEGGLRCLQPEVRSALAPGAALGGPFVLEAKASTPRICLNVSGLVIWSRDIDGSTHVGIAFEDLTDSEAEGLQWFLGAACGKRGSR